MVNQSYFFNKISQNEYRNIIVVSDGETEYELFLDKNNKPLFDNVTAIETIKNIDVSSFNEFLTPLGLKLHEYYDIDWYFSFEENRYNVSLSVPAVDRLNIDSKEGIYSLLATLKNKGIDELCIVIHAPNLSHGETQGVQLYADSFKTNIQIPDFDEQYLNFVEKFFWDKQKFENKIAELTRLGYKNAYFYISKWYDGNTLEIILYCESEIGFTDEQFTALLKDMDDSYIKIDGADIIYVLRHETK